MDSNKLSEFYERLYFSEIDNKDKLYTRIQMAFGLIVLSTTVITYLLKNTSFDKNPCAAMFVVLFSVVSLFLVIISCWLLKEASWGNDFKYLPRPKEINIHYENFVTYEPTYIKYCEDNGFNYSGEYNPNKKINDYLLNELIECTSWNTSKNEFRSQKIYSSITFFFYSIIPLVIAVAIFLAMDLDSASPRKPTQPHYIIVSPDNLVMF
ncbi:TPA: hypothetical protein SLN40_002339 [Serratia marcescens]|nr:hypothetical protein [Serratia marcescens]HEI9729030.1 hypothetical protein [Serratia marcescens]HEI9759481.1 hypothetical protein [Serratia marcescens]